MRYAHTNIVARDWKRLATFYTDVLGCRTQPPARDQSAPWLAWGTGVPDAALEGVHLLLPGYGEAGPTLEIYTYTETLDAEPGEPNRRGIGHLAFEVDDVEGVVRTLQDRGGSLVGKVSQGRVEGVGLLTFVYARDPEGNIIELQSWKRDSS